MATTVTKDMIKPFTGEGDVVAWLKKVRLVAKLQKITDVASLIPLYLEKDALSLYLEMSESAQASADQIEARLKEAFTDGAFTAFGKLTQSKWTGEQVDVYANEIRRLAGLAGFEGVGLEKIVKLTFVNGFPDGISVALQQVPDILTVSMSDAISRARILTAKMSSGVAAVTVQMDGRQPNRSDDRPMQPKGGENRVFRGQCYRCGGPHMARVCKEQRVIVCYRCNKPGHMANKCEQGNENGGTAAPAVTPSVV